MEETTAASGTMMTTQQQQYLLVDKKDDDDVHVPTELMHRIQYFLSLLSSQKEAARTCVLSKSWLHAWSTYPDLLFFRHRKEETEETKSNNLVYRTVQTYHDNGVRIQALAFEFHVRDPIYTEFWFRLVLSSQTTRYLKYLTLEICNLTDSGFTFSDDILFSGDKLQSIYLEKTSGCRLINPGINPVVKCVSLRVLELRGVDISEDVFHNLLSTCSLLEEVTLKYCRELKTIKVKNLGCLRRLDISSPNYEDPLLVIDNVPSLVFFYCGLLGSRLKNRLPFKTMDIMASSLGRSVKWLHLDGMFFDDTFFDMIKSKFPFLESLGLVNWSWFSERLVITGLSLKSLTLHDMLCIMRRIDLQVYAPCLLSFEYGKSLPPTVLFPTIAPKEIKFVLDLRKPFGTSFFLKLREVLINFQQASLTFICNSTVTVMNHHCSRYADDLLIDLRKRVMFPVTNVQQLCLEILDNQFSELKGVFDAFFSIFHSIHVKLWGYKKPKRFPKPTVVRGMMEYNTTDLKSVLIENPLNGRWEALTSSSKPNFLLTPCLTQMMLNLNLLDIILWCLIVT